MLTAFYTSETCTWYESASLRVSCAVRLHKAKSSSKCVKWNVSRASCAYILLTVTAYKSNSTLNEFRYKPNFFRLLNARTLHDQLKGESIFVRFTEIRQTNARSPLQIPGRYREWAKGWKDESWFPSRRGQQFFLFSNVLDRQWSPTSSLFSGYLKLLSQCQSGRDMNLPLTITHRRSYECVELYLYFPNTSIRS